MKLTVKEERYIHNTKQTMKFFLRTVDLIVYLLLKVLTVSITVYLSVKTLAHCVSSFSPLSQTNFEKHHCCKITYSSRFHKTQQYLWQKMECLTDSRASKRIFIIIEAIKFPTPKYLHQKAVQNLVYTVKFNQRFKNS